VFRPRAAALFLKSSAVQKGFPAFLWKAWSAYAQAKRQYDAELIDEEPGKPIPSYAWTHRPEYQFSQLSLEVDKIQREFTDESGQTQEQELLLDQSDGKIPTIRSDDELVSVFYSLIQQQQSRLRPLEGEQELVFGFGASEVRVTLSATGKVEFKDIAHIDFLDPVDFLTIRLYVNHDAGNTLWEWAFTRNGLHVYFQVLGNTETRNNKVENDIEILSLLQGPPLTAAAEAAQEATVRTLGGMRLRYRYQPPAHDGIELKKVEWKIAKRGRYCNNYGVLPNSCTQKESDQVFEQRLTAGVTDANIYWEPMKDSVIPQIGVNDTDWSNWAGTVTNDDGVKAHLKAEYTIPAGEPNKRVTKYYEQEFVIKTRELKPEAVPANVMKGSDVQMLEAILWQLGISPQKGVGYKVKSKAGISGRRIYSAIGKGLTNTCDGSDNKTRNIFSGGWDACAEGNVSMEGMVRRFKGRHISAEEDNKFARSGGANSTGVVDDATLGDLAKAWTSYYGVYQRYSQSGVIGLNYPDVNSWLETAVKLFDDGLGTDVPATYTKAKHESVLTLAGLSATAKTREELLKAWKSREAESHWGQGKPPTPYRMTEGGADELGSMSFNQVQFHFRYSRLPYKVHKNAGLNYFDPSDNLKGFVVHLSARPVADDATGLSHTGPFYAAFNTSSYPKAHGTTANLKGYKNCSDGVCGTLQTIAAKDDDYELLAKGVAAYNSTPGNKSWPNILKEKAKGSCASCEYSIDVRNVRYKLPYRQYIWKGGKYPKYELNADGTTKTDAQGNPVLHPKSEQDWCFAYGEQEWMSPALNPLTKVPLDWTGYKDAAEADEALQMNCN
jgi:hypothetical protein